MKHSEEVTSYIKNAPSPQSDIMEKVRNLIHESVPETVEEFKWGQPVFRKNKDYCYLKTTKSHVNLGFMNFQILNDPEYLLEGTGKQMRHVKLKTTEDIRQDLFKEWFIASADQGTT
jgi:hypothetical protein